MENASSNGFTLAELLIALALLGVIAAFTIPKVLQSSAEEERVAKLRETVASLENAWYSARSTGNYSPNMMNNTSLGCAIDGSLNTIRRSNRDMVEFVFAAGQPLDGLAATHPCGNAIFGGFGYLQFHNGVLVTNIDMVSYPNNPTPVTNAVNPICIDLNGAAAPNQVGQDVFAATFHPWGDFDRAGGVYTPSADRKSFLWGNAAEPLRDFNGSLMGAPFNDPQTWVGTWLTQ